MTLRIITKPVVNLTPRQFHEVGHATFGWHGMMYPELLRIEEDRDHSAIAIMLMHGHELLGWALLTPVTTDPARSHSGTSYTKRMSKYTAQFYVQKEHRRKGYAKMLMDEVLKHDKRPHVMPHDIKSGEFFANYDVTVTNWDKPNLRRRKPLAS